MTTWAKLVGARDLKDRQQGLQRHRQQYLNVPAMKMQRAPGMRFVTFAFALIQASVEHQCHFDLTRFDACGIAPYSPEPRQSSGH
jgi:hypothetical protein